MIFSKILGILFASAVLDSLVIIISGHPYGMLGNKAADASFIACMLPMVWRIGLYRKAVFTSMGAMIAAIIITKSSTGLAAIGVGAAAVLFQQVNIRKFICIVTPLTLLIAGFGFWYLGSELLDPSGRQVVWKEIWNAGIDRWMVGHGTGSFTDIGVALQKVDHPAYVWTWLHNDYLEVFYENGVLGLGLFLVLCGYTCRRLFLSRAVEFPIGVVYLFTAITEMPLRLFVTQVLGVCLLVRGLKDD